MSALSETVRAEASQITTRHVTVAQKMLVEAADLVLCKAEDLAENRQVFGEEVAHKIFNSLEGTLRTIMHADAKHKAHVAALGNIAVKVADNASPADVRATFTDLVAEAAAMDEEALERDYSPLKKLRTFRDSGAASGNGGAGPSGAGGSVDDDALGEDGFAFTQAARSTKCPLMQLEMTATGQLRPVKAPCGHTFSFQGITDSAKKKKTVKCPQAGCNRDIDMGQLIDDKELIKEIRKRERERER